MTEKDRMTASFYKMTKAYLTEGGGFVVKFTDPFTCSMATKDSGEDLLRTALSVIMGRAVSMQEISIEVDKEKQADGSLLDLIIEAAEDSDT